MRFSCLQETLPCLDIKDNFSNGLIIFVRSFENDRSTIKAT